MVVSRRVGVAEIESFACIVGCEVSCGQRAILPEPGSGMWRFVHLSDTHLGSVVDGEWNNRFLCTMMPDVMNCLQGDLAALNPAFILVTGDIASQQTRDATFASRDWLDALGFPYYPMGGNHDFVLQESRDWFIEAFLDRLPGDDTVYSFTHKGIHFCVLDPWWKWTDDALVPFSETPGRASQAVEPFGARWAIPPHEFAWLEEDLQTHSGDPTIVALHYPAIPIPKRLQREGLKDAGHLDNGDMLLDILSAHPQVKAVCTGHVHMHFIEKVNGLVHVSTGAMPEFPVEYRDVQVYEDRIEIHTCGLSDGSFALRSLIPGKEFTAGTKSDRTAVIPLV